MPVAAGTAPGSSVPAATAEREGAEQADGKEQEQDDPEEPEEPTSPPRPVPESVCRDDDLGDGSVSTGLDGGDRCGEACLIGRRRDEAPAERKDRDNEDGDGCATHVVHRSFRLSATSVGRAG